MPFYPYLAARVLAEAEKRGETVLALMCGESQMKDMWNGPTWEVSAVVERRPIDRS